VALDFAEPRPLAPDGRPPPPSLVADAEGAFRLPLRTSGGLSVAARSGEAVAALQLAAPQPTVSLEGGTLEVRRGGETLWRVALPGAAGPAAGPVVQGGRVLVGEGTTVVARDLERGRAVDRVYLSGPVSALDGGGADPAGGAKPTSGPRCSTATRPAST
jgi:hypothetical protein